jgi:hypothetical protein
MIKQDHLLKLNLWYELLYIYELIAHHLINVISWALRYECVFDYDINIWYVS